MRVRSKGRYIYWSCIDSQYGSIFVDDVHVTNSKFKILKQKQVHETFYYVSHWDARFISRTYLQTLITFIARIFNSTVTWRRDRTLPFHRSSFQACAIPKTELKYTLLHIPYLDGLNSDTNSRNCELPEWCGPRNGGPVPVTGWRLRNVWYWDDCPSGQIPACTDVDVCLPATIERAAVVGSRGSWLTPSRNNGP